MICYHMMVAGANSVLQIPNRTFFVSSDGITGLFVLAMGILARLRLAKIRNMARLNSPEMTPTRTKKAPFSKVS